MGLRSPTPTGVRHTRRQQPPHNPWAADINMRARTLGAGQASGTSCRQGGCSSKAGALRAGGPAVATPGRVELKRPDPHGTRGLSRCTGQAPWRLAVPRFHLRARARARSACVVARLRTEPGRRRSLGSFSHGYSRRAPLRHRSRGGDALRNSDREWVPLAHQLFSGTRANCRAGWFGLLRSGGHRGRGCSSGSPSCGVSVA